MSSQFKNFLFIFIILLIVACYRDLQRESKTEPIHAENSSYTYYDQKQASFQVVSYQIQQGDQFLTIVEKLNNQQLADIEQVGEDFQSLNPSVDIYQLKKGHVYLFPIYH